MKYIQKDIHYSITKKEQGILKIRRKYNNLSGCRTLSLFTYTTFYVFSKSLFSLLLMANELDLYEESFHPFYGLIDLI